MGLLFVLLGDLIPTEMETPTWPAATGNTGKYAAYHSISCVEQLRPARVFIHLKLKFGLSQQLFPHTYFKLITLKYFWLSWLRVNLKKTLLLFFLSSWATPTVFFMEQAGDE